MSQGTDVLIVSLGATQGLRDADRQLAESLRRAGKSVALVRARPVKQWRTLPLIELAWAFSARRAAKEGIKAYRPRNIIYSSTTAALFAPKRGIIRFDSPAAGNRPGRHGIWQRPMERWRFTRSELLLPWSKGAISEAPAVRTPMLVIPVAVDIKSNKELANQDFSDRRNEAITYAANPKKKGFDLVLSAWKKARKEGEILIVAGIDGDDSPGVRYVGMRDSKSYKSLLRQSQIFVTAPRREDYGIAQLDALANGCILVSTDSPGPYAALPLAKDLDRRLVTVSVTNHNQDTVINSLAKAIRNALDNPSADYQTKALTGLDPWSKNGADRIVAEKLVPLLN